MPQPPDALHERMVTVHEPYAYGATLQVVPEQVEVRATDVQVAGDVTDVAEYEVQVAPEAAEPQPPDAGQFTTHEEVLTPGGRCERNELNSMLVFAGTR